MSDLFLGLDIGTSGARALVIDLSGKVQAEAKSLMSDHGPDHRSPAVWLAAAKTVVRKVTAEVASENIRSMSVDGTSGTMLAVDANGSAISSGIMYNDTCEDADLLARITNASPETTAARGATSGLARAARLSVDFRPFKVLHQADWIAVQFGAPMTTDENNALKTGYDPIRGEWPRWVSEIIDINLLPEVVPAGQVIGSVGANDCGLPKTCLIVSGTTDGCASFLATGADQSGDGVSALGTTLTIKLLSDKPIFAPEYGIYSHKVLGLWLAGGASNTGGNVLLSEFGDADLSALSSDIDPETDTGLDYYPLSKVGERFPINDPSLAPRLGPRPAQDAEHLKAVFEGIANIEALAYWRLAELGAPYLRSVRTVGGGASNAIWSRIRARRLGVDMSAPQSAEAAYGAAILARAAI